MVLVKELFHNTKSLSTVKRKIVINTLLILITSLRADLAFHMDSASNLCKMSFWKYKKEKKKTPYSFYVRKERLICYL